MQGKINVVVGFVYKKYSRETGSELSRTTTFFDDFLGVCGPVTFSGNSNAPYFSRDRNEGTPLKSLKKKAKVLPRDFYEALVEAVACPPHHKGTANFVACVLQIVHTLITTL
jgi:hypothetical protein